MRIDPQVLLLDLDADQFPFFELTADHQLLHDGTLGQLPARHSEFIGQLQKGCHLLLAEICRDNPGLHTFHGHHHNASTHYSNFALINPLTYTRFEI